MHGYLFPLLRKLIFVFIAVNNLAHKLIGLYLSKSQAWLCI